DMYDGMMDACEYAGGAIIGGDVVRSDTFFVTVALEGVCDVGSHVMSRGAARVGDLIGVTGHLGCSAGGLALLLEDDTDRADSDESRAHLIRAHNRPLPRVEEGRLLRDISVRCAMDVSDGLTADLGKLCAASGVSAVVEVENLPADRHLRNTFPGGWREFALGGGEDYEIVFTASAGIMEVASERLGERVSVIGRIEEGYGSEIIETDHLHTSPIPFKEEGNAQSSPVRILDADGRSLELKSGGWDHFGV
ncbi:MAG: AIR synthase-related protein, partial [Dehalococcoidia bacterium]|nr:AIR synthase-related protein [Dehalococcoidia bacterium]